MSAETPNTVHGRLLEAVHIAGYSFERACSELEWLVDEGRWKAVANGFEDIDDFLNTVDLSKVRGAVEQRKRLAKKLDDVRASQRAIAGAFGVNQSTISRDLQSDANASKTTPKTAEVGGVQHENDANASAEKTISNGHHLSKNTGENEWYTPSEFIAAARDVLGAIDLDPASNELAQETVRAEQYFTKDDDGLARDWRGRVWLNPPYSQPQISEFIAKLNADFSSGCVTAAIMLTNNSTDTAWFHNAIVLASAVCFTQGRIKFWSGRPGEEAPSPLQGQAFFYFGDDHRAFAERFASIGFVVRPT